jgi:hypothetical protein
MKLSNVEKAYLAGLIDGEGYIGILRNKRGNKKSFHSTWPIVFTPVIKVAMIDRPVIEWLYATLGGSFETRKPTMLNQRESYGWTCRKASVATILKLIYPYLRVKKPHADIIFEYMTTRDGTAKPITKAVYDKRMNLYEQLHALTIKGPRSVRD